MVRHLEVLWLHCVYAGYVATGQDALALNTHGDVDVIITNPPYTRPLIRALIGHFARGLPTWLLIETDWASTKQAAPPMLLCSDIVSVGRLRHQGAGVLPAGGYARLLICSRDLNKCAEWQSKLQRAQHEEGSSKYATKRLADRFRPKYSGRLRKRSRS